MTVLERPSDNQSDADSIDLVADLREALADAYTDLIGHTRELSTQINAEFDAKSALETARDFEINRYPDPKTLGANEAARDAKLRAILVDEYAALEAATKAVQWRRQDQTLAQLRVDSLRTDCCAAGKSWRVWRTARGGSDDPVFGNTLP
jgi:hypothetical protein